jgi:hypothetical protein
MKKLLLGLLLAVTFASCKKSESQSPQLPVTKMVEIEFTSTNGEFGLVINYKRNGKLLNLYPQTQITSGVFKKIFELQPGDEVEGIASANDIAVTGHMRIDSKLISVSYNDDPSLDISFYEFMFSMKGTIPN